MRLIPVLTALLLGLLCARADAAEVRYDLLITGARVVDGTGARPFMADLLIKGDTIARIGDIVPDGIVVARTIDAKGRTLAPGFIDTHAHGDPLLDDLDAFIAMGVTTIVLGQDGWSANMDRGFLGGRKWRRHSLREWMELVEAEGVRVNVAALSGHATLRRLAKIPDWSQFPDEAQRAEMSRLLQEDLDAGSFGLSTGLEYLPGRNANADELQPLARIVSEADGVVFSHIRSENDGEIEGALRELVGYGAGARVHVSHLKVVFGRGTATADRILSFLEAQRRDGVRISADIYPYTAGYGPISLLFPDWALSDEDYKEASVARREELLGFLRDRMMKRGGPASLLFGSTPLVGKTLEQVAEERQVPFEQVLLDLGPNGAHGAHFIMDEDLQRTLVASPLTAISTDGGPGIRHPRSTGTYARLIEHFVRELGVLSIEEAVRKSSGLPASVLGLDDRGVLRVGAKADLILFDESRVKAMSDFMRPLELAEGFDVVVVNGDVVRDDGKPTGKRPGRALRRQGGKTDDRQR
jgi:N-acyl-D-amino-acid deacylase